MEDVQRGATINDGFMTMVRVGDSLRGQCHETRHG